jgi:hypothetical protein
VVLTSGLVFCLGQTWETALACAQRLKAFAAAVRCRRILATFSAARADEGQLCACVKSRIPEAAARSRGGAREGLEQKALLWAGGGCRVGCRRNSPPKVALAGLLAREEECGVLGSRGSCRVRARRACKVSSCGWVQAKVGDGDSEQARFLVVSSMALSLAWLGEDG